ncbi:hypothetical protein CEXT_459831 [Caerostris extrusa]|uniref:Uncharacterized protein n=1 Tax=Caerostris extrusa TaxID=172846 RepID=A0AAV4UDP1_CAEEX|nr:hypothetical protein CEXT_459831 [Caerostris extrusa]
MEIIFYPHRIDPGRKEDLFSGIFSRRPKLLERNNGNSGIALPGVTRRADTPLVVRRPPIFGGEGTLIEFVTIRWGTSGER